MRDQNIHPTLPSYLRPGLVDDILPALSMRDAVTTLLLGDPIPKMNKDGNIFQHTEIN